MDKGDPGNHAADAWDAARRLAGRVGSGGALACVASPVVLDPGEVAHAELDAYGWRFETAEVVYEQRMVLAGGGPLLFGLAAAGLAIGNRRAQEAAARLATPQWRPLGQLRVIATNRRLLVFHQSAWASVWLGAIRELHPTLEAQRLELVFEDDPPYAAGRTLGAVSRGGHDRGTRGAARHRHGRRRRVRLTEDAWWLSGQTRSVTRWALCRRCGRGPGARGTSRRSVGGCG